MALSLTKRSVKGAPLSATEFDGNMTAVETFANGVGFVSVTDPGLAGGADPLGVAFSDAAFAAAASRGGAIRVPAGTYKLHAGTVVGKASDWVFEPGAQVNIYFNASGTEKAFQITASNVRFWNATLDGSNSPSVVSANKYVFDVVGTVSGVEFLGCTIQNFTSSDGNTGLTNLIVTHAYYFETACTSPRIIGGLVNKVSGAAGYFVDTTELHVEDVRVQDTGWYSFNLDSGNTRWTFRRCRVTAPTNTGARHWGGSFNDMNIKNAPTSDASHNVGGTIDDCYVAGPHNYGAAIRLLSSRDVTVKNTTIEAVTQGTVGTPGAIQLIGADVRAQTTGGDTGDNGPPSRITLQNNTLKAGEAGALGVYIKNAGARGRAPGKKIIVTHNRLVSPDETTQYFGFGIGVHGLSAGFYGVYVNDNQIECKCVSGTPAGAVGFATTDLNGRIEHFEMSRNEVEQIISGRPSQSYEVGIYLVTGYFAQGKSRDNVIRRFQYGVRIGTTNVYRLHGWFEQAMDDCNNRTLFSANPDRVDGMNSWGAADPTEGVYDQGHRVRLLGVAGASNPGRYCSTAGGGSASTTAWTSGEVISYPTIVPTQRRNTGNRHYVALSAGTCATMPTGTTVGATEGGAGGDVLWLCVALTNAVWKAEAAVAA